MLGDYCNEFGDDPRDYGTCRILSPRQAPGYSIPVRNFPEPRDHSRFQNSQQIEISVWSQIPNSLGHQKIPVTPPPRRELSLVLVLRLLPNSKMLLSASKSFSKSQLPLPISDPLNLCLRGQARKIVREPEREERVWRKSVRGSERAERVRKLEF